MQSLSFPTVCLSSPYLCMQALTLTLLWHSFILDFDGSALQELISVLESANFKSYLTSVGGSGLGILSPYQAHRQVLQPVIGRDNLGVPESAVDDVEETLVANDSFKDDFKKIDHTEFSQWAEGRGRWLYV